MMTQGMQAICVGFAPKPANTIIANILVQHTPEEKSDLLITLDKNELFAKFSLRGSPPFVGKQFHV